MSDSKFTQRELLIRIDERQQTLKEDVEAIKTKLIPQSEHKNLMSGAKDIEKRVEMLERWQAKIMGQIAIFSVFGGVLAGFVFEVVIKYILNA